ncbi:MAG: hypothetical protein M5U31_14010 [Acidimicrobiia bacterium]|nr:hypothetical protein [Acidimicrobiia bacterium]
MVLVEADAEPPELPEQGEQLGRVTILGVPGGGVGGDLVGDESGDLGPESFLGVGELNHH